MSGEVAGRAGTVDVAIVGGGILGCSIAWHLKRLDPRLTVVVLDRHQTGTQATSQAAALLTRARAEAQIPFVARTWAAVDELAEALGEPLPVSRVGVLHVAASDATVALEGLVRVAAAHGIAMEEPSQADLPRLVPWLDPAAVRRCALTPDDGFVDPWLLAQSYAGVARALGAEIRAGADVLGIDVQGQRVTGVATISGALSTSQVIVACGAWTNLLTAPLGCPLPMAPVRSQYWITEPDRLFPRRHPAVVLPDASAYTRPELGALLFGVRERRSISVDPRGLPADVAGYEFSEDASGLQSLEEGAPALRRFLPALDRVAIRHYVTGFSTYTPDSRFALGGFPGLDGLLVASGCCGAGIAASGGIGLAIAEQALGRPPTFDLQPHRPDRFGTIDPFDEGFRARCAEARSRKTSG